MQYIEFYDVDLAGNTERALGSDGTQPVDGRLSIPSVIMEGARRARALRGVGRRYTAMKVLRGANLREARPVTGLIPIKVEGPQ